MMKIPDVANEIKFVFLQLCRKQTKHSQQDFLHFEHGSIFPVGSNQCAICNGISLPIRLYNKSVVDPEFS